MTNTLILGFVAYIFLTMPVSWSDQIKYIFKSYVVNQSSDLDPFYKAFKYEEKNFFYENDPMVRPGLPMIYSLFYLFDNSSINSIDSSVQKLGLYYLITLVGSIYFLGEKFWDKRTGLLSVFFY